MSGNASPALRQVLYSLLVALVAVGAGVLSLRRDGIFACKPPAAASDRYLSYCQATSYGDYDHGAFWYDLEPVATSAASNAQVMILGNSRAQIAFSTSATAAWFANPATTYFQLGFSHNVNYVFEGELLQRLHPKARVYLLNVDLFFETALSQPAKTVLQDPAAPTRYRQKKIWQAVQRRVCDAVAGICSNGSAFYRSRSTGSWLQQGGRFVGKPAVSWSDSVDTTVVRSYVTRARTFLPTLGVSRDCVILTLVPTVNTPMGTIQAVAAELGMELISPKLDSLITYDGSHLDPPSAERWSAALFQAAGPRIRGCLTATDSFPQPVMAGQRE